MLLPDRIPCKQQLSRNLYNVQRLLIFWINQIHPPAASLQNPDENPTCIEQSSYGAVNATSVPPELLSQLILRETGILLDYVQ